MPGLISELVDKFVGSSQGHSEHHESYESDQPPPPNCPYPWRARWDDREHRWYFVNSETNETVWDIDEVKRRAGNYSPSYGEQETSHYSQHTRSYGGDHQSYTAAEEDKKHGGDHGLAYGALGVTGGLAAGAGLMYAGDQICDEYEEDKYRMENEAENFPEDAAEWTGRKVGEVEDIPQDIEGEFDRFGNSVERKWVSAEDGIENAPENADGWMGEKIGEVENFGDDMDSAYDQGRYEGRHEYGD